MALTDGPLVVGYNTVTYSAEVWQYLVTSMPLVGGVTGDASTVYRFFDATLYGSNVYIVGHCEQTINGKKTQGYVWKFDGSSVTEDKCFTATSPNDGTSATTIVSFGGALYVGTDRILSGASRGLYIYRKIGATPWEVAHTVEASSIITGCSVLRSDNGYLLAIPATSGYGTPASYYYSSDGTTWSAGPAIDPSTLAPRYIFWDSVNSKWRWGGYDQYMKDVAEYTASTLSETSWTLAGHTPGGTTAGEIGKLAGPAWAIVHAGTSYTKKWNGTAWSTWFSPGVNLGVGYKQARATPRSHLGSWYVPGYSSGQSARLYKDGTAIVFANNDHVASGFVSTLPEDTWDVLQIESYKWGLMSFCDETTGGSVTVHSGEYLEISGDQGLDTPSYYDLQFGPTCTSLPDDWDMQFDMVLDELPTLLDVNGSRIALWVYNPSTERKAGLYISKQGIATYGLDTYYDVAENSDILSKGDSIRVKLTILTSDEDHQRAYLAIVVGGVIYKLGFMSYEKTNGSIGRVHIEAVGVPSNPAIVLVEAIRVRTHDFDAEDPDSIDVTKPVASIT